MAKPKTRQQENRDEPIRYFVQRTHEPDIVIEVAAHWRVTFGYVNPAKSADAYRSNEGHCLRLYEGEKLRAAISNVKGFRDLSIPVASKHERESGSATWTRDSDGNFEQSEKRELESEYKVEEIEEVFEEDDD